MASASDRSPARSHAPLSTPAAAKLALGSSGHCGRLQDVANLNGGWIARHGEQGGGLYLQNMHCKCLCVIRLMRLTQQAACAPLHFLTESRQQRNASVVHAASSQINL